MPVAPDQPDAPDAVLVTRARAGDPHAFRALVVRHQQRMFAVALRITGNRYDAEDATQNAFVAAWRRLPDYRGESSFSTWLYRIVTNHALNQLRGRARTDAQLDLDELPVRTQPATAQPGPAAHAEAALLIGDLRAALATLPPGLRVCWYAREVDGYSYEEVAEIAGVSYDVARGRIFRARQRLAVELKAWR